MSGYERFEDRERVAKKVFEILKEVGAIRKGHFVGTSGRHMEVYINKDALLKNPQKTEQIAELLAEQNARLPIDVVVAPSTGAIILGNRVAGAISRITGRNIDSVYTEKDSAGNQIFNRGYDKDVHERNVLIVEDTAATGLSLQNTIRAVQKAGGNIVRACVIVNRDVGRINSETMEVPTDWLLEMYVETFTKDACPLCAAEIPINTDVGHGRHS